MNGRTKIMEPETIVYYPQDHPWVEMSKEASQDNTAQESGLSEEILYSLDEIRVG